MSLADPALATSDPASLGRVLPPRRARSRLRVLLTPTLSLSASLLVHALLVLLAAAVVWRAAIIPAAPATRGAVIFDAPGMGDTLPVATPVLHTQAPHEASLVPVAEPSEAPLAVAAPSNPVAPLDGLTSMPAPPASSASALSGLSTLALPAGSGPAADVPDPSRPPVTFAGLGAASVSSVVYVVDCSGPMVTSLPFVMAELERSIGRLSPRQKFGVVLFRRITENAPAAESFAPVLVRATPSAKQLLHDWLKRIEPSGRSSPLAGLELGLSLKPDAVFLLSRAIQRSGGGVWDSGLDATMDRLDELNPADAAGRRPVLIQTIQFIDDDPTGILQAIGSRHGGGNGYRVVRRQQDIGSDSPPQSPHAPTPTAR